MSQVITGAHGAMEITSRPFELNHILSTFASEVRITSADLRRSPNLDTVAIGEYLNTLAHNAEVAAKREMLLEEQIQT
jgi:uncharacterized membrane protein